MVATDGETILNSSQAIVPFDKANRVRQLVPQLLEPSGQVSIVERKADVVLDDAQPFARPVGCSIHDASHVHLIGQGIELQRRAVGR